MAEKLEACAVCQQPVASKASKCPHCAARNPAPSQRRLVKRLVIAFVVVPIFLFGACLTAVLIGSHSGNSSDPGASSDQAASSDAAPSNPTGKPGLSPEQQTLDARLAVCVAVADEYSSALASRKVKDTIILANQYDVGSNAGGQAIGRALGDYFDGKWTDSDCSTLSTATWAAEQGYGGDPISLPEGAIKLTVCFEANYCS